MLEVCGVNDELLRVHGVAPGSKLKGVIGLMYKNLNGINLRLSENEKLEKVRELIHDLEVDVVCYNEHRLNPMHKDNRDGFSQLFQGVEADIRLIAVHNKHEGKEIGRVQEEGMAMLLYGSLIEKYDMESSGRDESRLGGWVFMTFVGEGGIKTRIVCFYNHCYNKNKTSCTSYQQ